MNVSLTPALERLVEKKVKAGFYNSASEVIREALRLLQEQDHLRELKLQDLRKEIAVGLEQANQGKLTDGREFFRKLRKRNNDIQQKK